MLCPSPGIYAVTTAPVESFTRAVFRSPELGFLGRTTPTRRHTPLRAGQCVLDRAGETAWRARFPFRIPRRTWFRVAGRAVVGAKARGVVVVNVRMDGCRRRLGGVERAVVRGRRVAGEKNWRRIEPTILGDFYGRIDIICRVEGSN